MTPWRLHTPTLFYSLLASLADVDLFLDVGSLDGREAFAVETRCPGVKCVAFEPNPRNIELIRTEIARRNSRVELETFAVGNENGSTTFYTRTPLNAKNFGASSVLQFANDSRNDEFVTSSIEVPTRRLDSIDSIASYKKIALWIDVEGAGYQVLEGLAGIAQTVQLMHIEAETKRWFEGEKLAPDFIEIMKRYGLELAGSNLDKDFHKPQGDLVFLRKQAVSGVALRRAVLTAWLVQRFAVQKIARKVLPAKLYRTGREWFVQNVATR